MAAVAERPRPLFDLTGKAALVTGGGRGIGRAVAETLAQAGAAVAVNDVSGRGHADEVAREVEARGGAALAVVADVSRPVDVRDMIQRVTERFGRLDVLVNNAGIFTPRPFLDIPEEEWDRVIDVNLKGQFLVAQAAARAMVERGEGGRILNVASIASGGVGVGFPGTAHYAASKGGVIALTETLAIELGPHGITVNAIAPGLIRTDMTRDLMEDPEGLDRMLARIPVGRAGEPEDVAALAAFLASDEAAYCNGAVFYVDGGWLAG
ncbi:MAG TPA: 3-oxoacyl-ACP reductase family protein [Candidatus Thermoplasmatota archaeon]|nr:3-oxoacyl-ACP reductase family protein [Candidatus Thermoplasmatota archaeon]